MNEIVFPNDERHRCLDALLPEAPHARRLPGRDATMMRMDGDYEDVTMYTLDADVEERLLLAHNECTFIWSNREGWPVGVIMSYVWRRGAFWLTASGQRARVTAVRRDPRVCVVVTSTGSPLPRNKAVTWKGTCTVHDDRGDQGLVLR